MSSAEGGGEPQMAGPPTTGPPYPPTTAQLGGTPTVALDDPVCAALLALYVAGAATHMVIFQVNRRRDHRFVFSALLFAFCAARSVTLALRIAWASAPRDVPLATAATVLVQAGVLLLFVVNLVFAQRLVRSYHPRVGWSSGAGALFKLLFFCVGAMLVMVITASVYSLYTLDGAARQKCRVVQLFAGTFLALLAFLPIPVTALAVLTPRAQRPEKFGQGRYRTKISLLLITSFVLTLGAAFRLAVNFMPPRPLASPAWYHSKPCFYCFNFAIELLVVYMYAVSRFDRRFHVPDGSSQPGHYSGSRMVADPYTNYVGGSRRASRASTAAFEINREADVFGDDGAEWDAVLQSRRESDWETRAIEELNKASQLEPA